MRNLWISAFAVLLAAQLTAGATNQQSSQPAERRPSAQPTQSGAQVFRTYSEAVAVIEATDSTSTVVRFGSGVLLDRQQVIVTNAHVVIGPGRIRARLGTHSYSPSEIEVRYVDADADLAILKLSTIPQGSPTVRLRTGALPDVGERVFAIGNPQGLERTFSEGVVSGVRSLPEIGIVIQHTAAISPGSSGGALFSSSGELIGLTVAYLDGGQNLNFAIPATGVASAVAQALDVPSDTQDVDQFAARTRKRFPGLYNNLENRSLASLFRRRYPLLGGAATSFNEPPALPPQLIAFVQGLFQVLNDYNKQVGTKDLFESPEQVLELQALNRRRLTRLRLLEPPTAKTREAAHLLIAAFEEVDRRFEYYVSPAIPFSLEVHRNLMRNEIQLQSDGFAALTADLIPYKDAATDLFGWVQDSYEQTKRSLNTLSSPPAQQSTAPPSIAGTWFDAGGTFANRLVRTANIAIAPSDSGGFVLVFTPRTFVEGFNYLLGGKVAMANGSITGELSVGFYVKLPGINEVCSKKAALDLQSSGPDLLVGTARFGNTIDSGVRSETFRALCLGLPFGTKAVRLQRIR